VIYFPKCPSFSTIQTVFFLLNAAVIHIEITITTQHYVPGAGSVADSSTVTFDEQRASNVWLHFCVDIVFKLSLARAVYTELTIVCVRAECE
jgi:hypothetical protein